MIVQTGQVQKMIDASQQMISGNMVFEIERVEKLPLILADPERLKQALINLIGNSIKYTEKGNVKVTTEIKDSKLEIKKSYFSRFSCV